MIERPKAIEPVVKPGQQVRDRAVSVVAPRWTSDGLKAALQKSSGQTLKPIDVSANRGTGWMGRR